MLDGTSDPIVESDKSSGRGALGEASPKSQGDRLNLRARVYGQLLWIASVVASVLVIPYTIAVLRQAPDKPSVESLKPMLAEGLAESAILSMLLIALGLKCGPSVGLGWPPLDGWGAGPENRKRMRSALKIAVILGVVAATFDVTLSWVMQRFADMDFAIETPSWWASLLGSIGAGISEEIWLRLGIMTFFVWLLAKLAFQKLPVPAVIWTGNLLACLIFGALHLPQGARVIGHLSGPIVAFALIGNGVPGLMFGWLYWRKGLFAAMVCHAWADIMIKVILPAFGF
jgi:membrane protease YdiL (CAAX protease family)